MKANGMRDSKVPSYRLTPEFSAWRKAFGKHHAVQKVLGQKLQTKMSELQQLQMAYQQVSGAKKQLLQLMPNEQVFELEGQRAQTQQPDEGMM